MTTAALELAGVTKEYRTVDGTVVAVDGVDLRVEPGVALALVGANGAGKSTLLRLAAGITVPTAGRVVRTRRMTALIEVGAAFDPELTGAENLDVGLALSGFGRRARRSLAPAVVEMAGIEDAVGTPVKRWSNGMRARLAVAIALHTSPELLLVDEVLAVGDQAFQRAAVAGMQALVAEGTAVVLVTHDPGLAIHAATRAVWLEHGRVAVDGEATAVVEAYVTSAGATRLPARRRHTTIGSLTAEPTALDAPGPLTLTASVDREPDAPPVRLLVEVLPALGDAQWWMRGPDDSPALRTVSVIAASPPHHLDAGAGRHEVRLELPGVPWSPPEVDIRLVVLEADEERVVDEAGVTVTVAGPVGDTPVQLAATLSPTVPSARSDEGVAAPGP